MKFRVVGGPVKGTVIVEGKHSDKFEKIFKKVEKEVGKGLWDTYTLFPATVLEGTRRAVPIPTVIQPQDTPDKLNLVEDKKNGTPVLLMLREKAAPMPPPLSAYRDELSSLAASITPSRPEPPSSVSDRHSQADSALVTPATTPREHTSETGGAPAGTPTTESTVGTSYHDRLTAIYSTYEPAKLHTVNGTLKKFKGREEAVIKQLVKKYGPEPVVQASTTPAAIQTLTEAPTVAAAPAAPSPPSAPRSDPTPERPLESRTTAVTLSGSVPPNSTSVHSDAEDNKNGAADAHSAPSSPAPGGDRDEATPSPPPAAPVSAAVTPGGAGQVGEPSFHDRLTAIYTKYDPSKVRLVEGTLRKFKGKEEAVIKQLVKKYGPEPPVEASRAAPRTAAPANVYRDAITAILRTYDPDNVSMVEPLLERYAGQEEVVVKRLLDKYKPANSSSETPDNGAENTVEAPSTPAAAMPPATESPKDEVDNAHEEDEDAENNTEGSSDNAKPTTQEAQPETKEPVRSFPPEDANAATPSAPVMTEETVDKAGPVATVPLTSMEPPAKDAEADVSPSGDEVRKTARPSPIPEDTEGTTAVVEPGSATPPPAVEVETRATESEVAAAHGILRADTTNIRELEVVGVSPAATKEAGGGAAAFATTTSATRATPVTATEAPPVARVPVSEPPPQSGTTAGEATGAVVTPMTETHESASPISWGRSVPGTPFNTPVVSAGQAAQTVFPPPPSQPSAGASGAAPSSVSSAADRAHSAGQAPAMVASQCARFMQERQEKAARTRYWHKWLRFRNERAAEGALDLREWIVETVGGAPSYRLNDSVQPPFAVRDLATYKGEQSRAGGFSDSVLIGLRALIDSLVRAFRGQVVDVSSVEDEAMLNAFVHTWANDAHMCPVRDGPELAAALHQAAQLLSQLEELMAVTKTQSDQLHELKAMHDQLTEQLESREAEVPEANNNIRDREEAASHEVLVARRKAAAAEARVAELQSAVASRDSTIKTLNAQLQQERLAVTDVASARTPRSPCAGGLGSAPTTAKSPSSWTLRKQLATTEREVETKDSQIAQLQQELAKARTLLHRTREKSEQLAQDLRASTATEERLRRDLLTARQSSRASPARSPRTGRRTNSTAHGAGVAVLPATFSAPGFTLERTPRGRAASPSLSAIRQPTLSTDRGDRSADASRLYQLADGVRGNGRESSWPRSRYLPPPTEIERGPCPNCLTPLVSCSPEITGPVEETAAFCFSCRRAFTFGDLIVRDKIADMGQL